MVVEDLGFVNEQWALYQSVCSPRTICRERWQLPFMETERDLLFEQIAAEADAKVARAITNSTLPTPATPHRRAGPQRP